MIDVPFGDTAFGRKPGPSHWEIELAGARAEGFRMGVEAAAKIVNDARSADDGETDLRCIRDRIKALLPTPTERPTSEPAAPGGKP